ncbi:MAG: Vps62-related protein [Planctomycetes bacterium]|nr:Vps62-related protein [Planctomycetota bacterium]
MSHLPRALFTLFATLLAVALVGTTAKGQLPLSRNSSTDPNALSRDLTPAEIALYAPVVYLHPLENWFPMDPAEFIRRARFRHHRGWQSDQGFHRITQQWVTTNSHAAEYYDIPNNVLAAYTLHGNGENRRPRDSNCGDSYNVFLETDANQAGVADPNRTVPVFYTYRRDGSWHKIQYWWFFGYNQTPVPGIAHQGDWEHVTVHVYNGAARSVYFAAHEGGTTRQAGGFAVVGRRPVVYLAAGTHAAYWTSGLQSYPIGLGLSFVDFTGTGRRWETALNLRPLATQPWKDFAGAWGEVGNLGTTTGPLGPWFKRNGL